MQTKLLWLMPGGGEAEYYAKIAQALAANYQVRSDFLVFWRPAVAQIQALGHPCITIQELLQRSETSTRNPDELIAAANRLLGKIDVNLLLHGDIFLNWFTDHEAARVFIARCVLALDAFLERSAYAGCLRPGTGSSVGRACTILAEARGIAAYALTCCHNINTCGLSPAGVKETWTWTSFARSATTWRTKRVSKADRERIDEFVATYYEAHRTRPRTMRVKPPYNLANISWWQSLKALLKRLLRKAPVRSGKRPGPLFLTNQERRAAQAELFETGMHDVLGPAWSVIRHEMNRASYQALRNLKYDPVPRNYVYLPFVESIDAPHRCHYPMNYLLQEYLVRMVKESLPYGSELVIKQHPYALSDPPIERLREMQKLGVKIADPRTHSLELIKNAQAVFCLGDTSGWEGLLLKVPVIVFGTRPFYAECPLVWTLTDANRIPETLLQAIRAGEKAYADRDLWYAFIHRVFESAAQGNAWGYTKTLWSESDESQQNLRNIAAMIMTEGGFGTQAARKALDSLAA